MSSTHNGEVEAVKALPLKPASRSSSLSVTAAASDTMASAHTSQPAPDAGGVPVVQHVDWFVTAPQPPPLDRLTGLPSLLLVQVAARLRLRDATSLASCSMHLHTELRALRATHAVARAMLEQRKPRCRVSSTTRGLLKRVACTPEAITYLHGLVEGDSVRVLLRPDVCEWVVKAAATRRDIRTLDWLLGVYDPRRAELLRYYINPTMWDEYLVLAVGHATGAGHLSLAQLLLRLPSAPGQPWGLRRLNQDRKNALLVGAMTAAGRLRSPVADLTWRARELDALAAREQERVARAALELLHPLCLLPHTTGGRLLLRWPFGEPLAEEVRAEEQRVAALMAAAHAAVEHNVRGAVTALHALGLDVSNVQACRALIAQAMTNDAGDALHELFMLPCTPAGLPVIKAHKAYAESQARQAWAAGKARVVSTALDYELLQPDADDVAYALRRGHVDAALAVLQHPKSLPEVKVPFSPAHIVVDAAVRYVPDEAEAARFWRELFALGQRVPGDGYRDMVARQGRALLARLFQDRRSEVEELDQQARAVYW